MSEFIHRLVETKHDVAQAKEISMFLLLNAMNVLQLLILQPGSGQELIV